METNTGYSKADKGADNWISAGCSPSKIELGLSTYGYAFTLANPSNNGVGAAVSGGMCLLYCIINLSNLLTQNCLNIFIRYSKRHLLPRHLQQFKVS